MSELNILVPRGEVWQKPRQYKNVMQGTEPTVEDLRVNITLEPGSAAKVLLCDHSQTTVSWTTTQQREVLVGEGASLELYEIEETHPQNRREVTTTVRLQRGASAILHCTTLSGGFTSNRTHVILEGEGANVTMYGCVIADGRQQTENHTLIHHQAPNCRSKEVYKYVLDDEAKGFFEGRILVTPGADGTESDEVNANLLSSDKARMQTKPELEIYADDVQCSHGSTVGQLSEQALFYMQQRGISLPEARILLKQAFLGEVLDVITLQPLATQLRMLVEKRLVGGISKCEACKTQCKR